MEKIRNSKGQFLKGVKYRLGLRHSEKSKEKNRQSQMKRFEGKELLKNKIYVAICPDCGNERNKTRLEWCEIMRGKKSQRCWLCTLKRRKITTKGFPKGHVPWNAGTGHQTFSQKIKHTRQWKEMRKKVFERDNFTCQKCGKRGGELHPDHILPKAIYQDLVFDLSNIRTLCAPCHRKTPTFGVKLKT